MSTIVTFNSAHMIPLASEFFMARRPILDSREHLVAHELLFCKVTAHDGAAPIVHHGAAAAPSTASVIADVMQHGLVRIIGDVTAHLQVDADTLMSDLMQDIPCEHVVLSIMEATTATPQLLERITDLAQRGFVFALEANADSEPVRQLLPVVDTVKIDIRSKTPEQLNDLCRLFKSHQKKLLAERVDTAAQFEQCAALGFDYFQGYFFTKPPVACCKKLTPSQLAITELMELIASDADDAEIEHRIKSNVALGLNLLRLANTPAISAHRIDSLRQALMVVGRDQLLRWLRIMLYADAGKDGHSMMPLLMLATTRGHLLELVAQKLKPGNRGIADTAFMVGIMSLMDTVFCMPMPEILRQIPVAEEVSDALLSRKGYFGMLLTLAEHAEWVDKESEQLLQLIDSLRLSHNDLYVLQLAAFEWSDQVSRSLH